jgi:hypothetical protein
VFDMPILVLIHFLLYFLFVSVQDASTTKPSKKMPLSLWKLVLVLILFFAVYMMYVGLQQYGVFSTANLITVRTVSKAPTCHMPAASHSDASFLHFLKPVTYDRYYNIFVI